MLYLREGVEPRAYVPDPWDARYECSDVMAMEREVQELLWALVRALKPKLVVEIGSHRGSTAEVIGNALEDNGGGRLVSIEIDENLAGVARRRCEHLAYVEIVTGDCLELAGTWTDIDLLIVDGGTERRAEHEAFGPFLSPNAIVVRHDVLNEQGTQLRAGDLAGFDTVILNTPRGLSLSQRPVGVPD
jgi:predicted O-methyltransferase YrrM